MPICSLCRKKFETQKGLKLHKTRSHKIPRQYNKIRKITIKKFLPLLENKKWALARKLLPEFTKIELEKVWLKGYLHALKGIIFASKRKNANVKPYILNMRKDNGDELKKSQNTFTQIINIGVNTKFDKGYFHAWDIYLSYLLKKS